QAIKAYQQAYEILKKHPTETNPFVKDKILVANDIELVHRGLLKLQANRNQEVWNSLKEHFYAELESFLNREKPDWRAADRRTWRLMLFIANREEERYLDIPQFENFSCPDLKRMDELWVKNSRGNFGFSVQKKIWVKTGNRLGIKPGDWNDSDTQNYYKFISAVGWYNDKKYNAGRGSWVSYSDIIGRINKDPISPRVRGGLPGSISVTLSGLRLRRVLGAGGTGFFSRVATCKL
nr:GUN4 domain-containing protein [Calothrix sp. MO_192.B10]